MSIPVSWTHVKEQVMHQCEGAICRGCNMISTYSILDTTVLLLCMGSMFLLVDNSGSPSIVEQS